MEREYYSKASAEHDDPVLLSISDIHIAFDDKSLKMLEKLKPPSAEKQQQILKEREEPPAIVEKIEPTPVEEPTLSLKK